MAVGVLQVVGLDPQQVILRRSQRPGGELVCRTTWRGLDVVGVQHEL